MNAPQPRRAIVWCDGGFLTPEGKTAHGLVRHTDRYRVLAVIDARHAGGDAGDLLDGRPAGIPVVPNLEGALAVAEDPTHFVIGLAPDGGRLPADGREAVRAAIAKGLHVDCGLHDYLSEDDVLADLARSHGVQLTDVRKPPSRDRLHGFTGKISEVDCLRLAVLGTDSAIGKRTTTTLVTQGLRDLGVPTQMVGTGQTAWLQGVPYCIVLDSLVNDFVAGELEHAVWSAWTEQHPEAIVVEGQGSLMNPAYPGGFEILAATRPHAVLLQHAPKRREYDGFPGFPIHPLPTQIQAIELISGRPVVAVTLNHEELSPDETHRAAQEIQAETGLPAFDVLLDGPEALCRYIKDTRDQWMKR